MKELFISLPHEAKSKLDRGTLEDTIEWLQDTFNALSICSAIAVQKDPDRMQGQNEDVSASLIWLQDQINGFKGIQFETQFDAEIKSLVADVRSH